jgi:hypothetical protein
MQILCTLFVRQWNIKYITMNESAFRHFLVYAIRYFRDTATTDENENV